MEEATAKAHECHSDFGCTVIELSPACVTEEEFPCQAIVMNSALRYETERQLKAVGRLMRQLANARFAKASNLGQPTKHGYSSNPRLREIVTSDVTRNRDGYIDDSGSH